MTIGTAVRLRIEQLCYQRRLTFNKLATVSGITQSTINNIMNGASANPTISTIKKICDGLELPIYDFFDAQVFRSLEQEIR